MLRYIFLFIILSTSFSFAHLCNDVFIQAKDNLAVKVDIRDGQLRLSDSASFRVYLLNTMDRNIANINLDVVTKDFMTAVKPSPEWDSFPVLKTKVKGGKKEFFEVTLKRKQGVAQGKYKIGLKFYNGEDSTMEFKTVDLGDAMAEMKVPEKPAILAIDGNVKKDEWQGSLLCTSLYEYKKEGSYYNNCTSSIQTRFRFFRDEKSLYCMLDFETNSVKDIARLYFSKDDKSPPRIIEVNLQEKKVTADVKFLFNSNKLEMAIPLSFLGAEGEQTLLVNLTREQDGTETYWRGNKISADDPVQYATFVIK